MVASTTPSLPLITPADKANYQFVGPGVGRNDSWRGFEPWTFLFGSERAGLQQCKSFFNIIVTMSKKVYLNRF